MSICYMELKVMKYSTCPIPIFLNISPNLCLAIQHCLSYIKSASPIGQRLALNFEVIQILSRLHIVPLINQLMVNLLSLKLQLCRLIQIKQ